MMNVQTCAGLKRRARGILLSKYRSCLAIVLAVSLFNNILLLFNGMNVLGGTIYWFLIQALVSLAILLFNGIITVGVNSFYLNIVCKQPYSFQDLFLGFKFYPEKALAIRFFLWILERIPLIPFYAVLLLIFLMLPSLDAILSRLPILVFLYGAGWLIGLFMTGIYSQSFYLLLDFPDMSIRQLLTGSRKLMKGHLLRYIYTKFSFLPLMIAGFFSFGVGLLLLSPYRDMTLSLFYLDLLQTRRYQSERNI